MIQIEDFVVKPALVDRSLDSMKAAALSGARSSLERHGIVRGNTGNLVHHLQTKTPWEQLLQTEKSTELELVGARGHSLRYKLLLEEREVKAEYCTMLQDWDLAPRIFTLHIRGQEFSRVLQSDKVMYRSRHCPYVYKKNQVYS